MDQEEAQTKVRRMVWLWLHRRLDDHEITMDDYNRLSYHEKLGKLYDERDGSTFVVEVRELK